MTAFVLLAGALGVLTAAWLTRPLWRSSTRSDASTARVTQHERCVGLAAALALFVIGMAAGGYAWLGSPRHAAWGGAAPAATPPRAAAPSPQPTPASRAQAMAQVEAMVERLAKRLESQPDDAQGWQMLARSHAVLNQHGKAVDAFRQLTRLRPADATLLADFAFSLAMSDERRFAGEAGTLIEQALQLEPHNTKALALAGTAAFERRDYAGAVRHWERLAQVEPGDSPFAQQIRSSIAQARQLAGTPP